MSYYDLSKSKTYARGEAWEQRVKSFFEKSGFQVNVNVFDRGDGRTTQRRIVDGDEYIYPDLSISVVLSDDVEFYVEVKSHKRFYRNIGFLSETKLNPTNSFVFVSKYKFNFYKKFKAKFGKPVYIMFAVGNSRASRLFSSNIEWLDKTKIFQSGYPFGKGCYPDGTSFKRESLYFWDVLDLKELSW